MMRFLTLLRLVLANAFVASVAVAADAGADTSIDALAKGFQNPPDSARPRTWWHWTNGNVTQEGITKDLEWMKRAGLAGFQLADVSFGLGQEVEEKVDFGSPEWLNAARHAAEEAERLDLEMAIFSSAGWSLTGGPWVKPEEAMKKLVWSETTVTGPSSFSEKLPQPPMVNGPIQDLARGGSEPNSDPTYYGDSAVVAFRKPSAYSGFGREVTPRVTTHAGESDTSALLDENLNTTFELPGASESPAWIQYEFPDPIEAHAVTIAGARGIPVGRILASVDGSTFRPLVALPGAQLYRQGLVRTFSFPPTRARFFRLEVTGAPLGPAETMSQEPAPPAESYVLRELAFHQEPRIHRWEDKAAFSFLFEYESTPTPSVPPELATPLDRVIDLTDRMGSDGQLDWEVPEGEWTILRLGYSLTGAKNRPATEAGLGYEVDKLDPKHVLSYYSEYAGMLKSRLGPLYGTALSHMLIDSWEAGMQNWSENMLNEFARRRGYDPTPYLPALTGRVIGSAEISDRFLWDFRRTLVDMFADNFYRVLDEALDADGLSSYSEASGVSLEVIEDTLLNKSHVDIPMGEFWARDLHPTLMYYQDVRGAASAAHVYDKPIVAAEAYTGGGFESPFDLKKVSDYWLAQGINRIVFHTSAHQPLDTIPGNVMVGTHFHRNITWAEQARPFVDYLSRQCFLLQQGKPVADLLYLLPEGAPSTMPLWGAGLIPKPPKGYDYDYINVDVLLTRLEVDDSGAMVLPNGLSYRLLILPERDAMRPEVIQRIQKLLEGGAAVLGPRPIRSPSLAGYSQADEAVRETATAIWGDLDGHSRTMRQSGRGHVFWGLPVETVLSRLEALPSIEYAGSLDAEVAWKRRRLGDIDYYYLANLSDDRERLSFRFPFDASAADVWRPDDGSIKAVPVRNERGRTVLDVEMQPRESFFVVFHPAATTMGSSSVELARETLATIEGPWDLRFPPNMGVSTNRRLETTQPWNTLAEPGAKFFSGTATYETSFEADSAWLASDSRVFIDLGKVGDLAEVTLNGEDLGISWKPPYRVEVTNSLQPGRNELRISVTNQWTNRLIGDAELPVEERVLQSNGVRPGRLGERSLAPRVSGLSGPVTLVREYRSEP